MFQVSLDNFAGNQSGFLVFKHLVVNHTPQTFDSWLTAMCTNLETLARFDGDKAITFTAKDIPIFHYFHYPHLCAFKMFFWMRSILNYPEFQRMAYSPEHVPERHSKLGAKIFDFYSQVPATEIWADETTNVTLKQLSFYKDAGFFKSTYEIECILDDYSELLTSIRDQSIIGRRPNGTKFNLYKNEILIADNTALFKMNDHRITFISHNLTELLMTTDAAFCLQSETFIENLQNRSMLISTIGERERNRFFNEIERKVQAARYELTGKVSAP